MLFKNFYFAVTNFSFHLMVFEPVFFVFSKFADFVVVRSDNVISEFLVRCHKFQLPFDGFWQVKAF